MDEERSVRRVDGFVLAALIAVVGVHCFVKYEPYSFLFRDGMFYAHTNRAIAQDLTLRQEGVQPMSWYEGKLPWYRDVAASWSNVSVGAKGEYYPKHSFLMPVASTPFYLLLGLPGLLVFNALMVVLGLFAAYRLAARHVREGPAAVAVLAILASPLIPYLTYAYSFDAFYGALVLGGAAVLAGGRPLIGGLLLGLSLWAKPTNLLIVAPLALALATWERRALVRLAIGGAIPLVAAAVANALMYGYPWLTSYSRMLVVEGGRLQIQSLQEGFGLPLDEGLERLWDGADGYNVRKYALLPVLSYVGLLPLGWLAWRRRGAPVRAERTGRLTWALAAAAAGFVSVFGRYEFVSVRFLMPWVLAAVVPLAALVDAVSSGAARLGRLWQAWRSRRGRLAVAGATTVGLVVALVAARASDSPRPGLAQDLERLTVTLDGTPCDYLNLRSLAWECSKREARGGYLVGRALGDRCAFAEQPMLWAPPSPKKRTRVIRWVTEEPASSLEVVWGMDESAARGVVYFTVRVGERPAVKLMARDKETLHRRRLVGRVPAGTPVVVTIPGTKAKKRFLCLNVSEPAP